MATDDNRNTLFLHCAPDQPSHVANDLAERVWVDGPGRSVTPRNWRALSLRRW